VSVDWRSQPTSIPALWREIEKLRTVQMRDSERQDVWFVAKALAEINGQQPNEVFKRILPRDEEQLENILRLFEKIKNHTLVEMIKEPFFSDVFLNFHPTPYQLKFLEDASKQIATRWSRQSGKTKSFGIKGLKFCVLHPMSQAIIVAPGLRQSMLVCDRFEETYYQMAEPARKAWVSKLQRTKVTFHNRSRMKFLPYSLHRLRGETSDLIFVDEAAFIRDDEILFDNVLKPMMATRWEKGAQIIASSTPWGRNNMFYRFCKDPKIAPEWSQHHVTWKESVQAGLIPLEFIEKQKREILSDRFLREYEAEFTEDIDRWLPQDLISSCVSSDIEAWEFEDFFTGKEVFLGVDLGKKVDYSVVAATEKVGDTIVLRHVKVFDLETPYASVIGYVKVLSERWRSAIRVFVDQTGVGEYIVEDMKRAGIDAQIEGVLLSLPAKEEICSYLKQKMQNKQFSLYYDNDIISNLNTETFELTKDGRIHYAHPEGTHDDIYWSIALACTASRSEPQAKLVRAY